VPTAATVAHTLAEALPYLRAYHGKTIVAALRRTRDDRPGALKENFARDVALLRLVGMKPIVVHGGGWRIDELLATMGMPSHRHDGVRVTDAKTLNVVEMALDEINQELTGLVNRHGGRAVGINGQYGRFIRAVPHRASDGVDVLRRRRRGHRLRFVHLLLSKAFVPVILPLGVAEDGTAFHIDSDRAGASRALKAEKLIPMTNAGGIIDASGRLAYILTRKELDALLASGAVAADLSPARRAAVEAVRAGVRSVHIIDGGVASALLLEVLDGRRRRHGRSLRRRDRTSTSRAYLLER
jgi:acetylglutamate kinase